MSKVTDINPTSIVAIDPTDQSMIPGSPTCDYTKYMAAQPKVQVICPSDQRNPQYKTLNLSFNGNHSIQIPFDRPTDVPRPYASMILMGAKGTVTNDPELVASLAGQVAHPIYGAIAGPLSGSYVGEIPS